MKSTPILSPIIYDLKKYSKLYPYPVHKKESQFKTNERVISLTGGVIFADLLHFCFLEVPPQVLLYLKANIKAALQEVKRSQDGEI